MNSYPNDVEYDDEGYGQRSRCSTCRYTPGYYVLVNGDVYCEPCGKEAQQDFYRAELRNLYMEAKSLYRKISDIAEEYDQDDDSIMNVAHGLSDELEALMEPGSSKPPMPVLATVGTQAISA